MPEAISVPPALAPVVLAAELFAIFVLPFVIFTRSGMFPRDMAFQLAAVLATIFYFSLPDPIDVGFIDDIFVAGLMLFLCLPVVRSRVLDLITRPTEAPRPPQDIEVTATRPDDVEISPAPVEIDATPAESKSDV